MLEILEKPQPKSADDKRARLLAAALELFESRGFDGVSVPEIAAKAGVAVGTVYRYFETKEALVNALYRHWKTIYNEVVLAPLPPGLSIRGQFGAYWQRMTLFARARSAATRFMDLHHHGNYLDEESRALSRTYREAAEAFIREGRKAGAIRDLDPVMVVALMWGAAAGLVKFASQGALDFDGATATDMEEALWRAIAK
ncbi:MAG TPA: TetR/AcrR family transcriptional regulator [Rhizomicrobium sp.]|jgi:AcrR family transcriptional regulator|nr:TetR/AcrR family transcriptional regulator [Rhizomicrobium sp.]